MQKNLIFAITISPPYRFSDPHALYFNDLLKIRRWVNRFSDHYAIWPEFTENARLHYHGVIKLRDPIKFYKTKYKFDKLLGFVKIDKLKTFKDHLRWLFYCQKDYHLIRDNIFKRIDYLRISRIYKAQHKIQTELLL